MAIVKNKGILKTWKDDRGFGFIKPDDGSDDLFIHISALKGMPRRPNRGDTIIYQIEHENNGKSKAIDAYIDGIASQANEKITTNKWLWVTAIVLGLISAAAAAFFGIDEKL